MSNKSVKYSVHFENRYLGYLLVTFYKKTAFQIPRMQFSMRPTGLEPAQALAH